MPHIHFITLNTGDDRRSERSEVSDKVRPRIAAMLQQAIDMGSVRFSFMTPPPVLHVKPSGRCATFELYVPPLSPLFTPDEPNEPDNKGDRVLTFGVASHSRCGAGLWRDLLAEPGDDTLYGNPTQPPEAPWCAVRLNLPVLAELPRDTIHALADIQRCFAWAWLDRVQSARNTRTAH